MQHHPDINLFPRDGVHDAETMEAVFGPAGRDVEPLESWTVVTCDWSLARQGPYGHSVSVGASRGDRSTGAPSFTSCSDLSGTGKHLSRDRLWPIASGYCPTPATRRVNGESGGRPPWRATSRLTVEGA